MKIVGYITTSHEIMDGESEMDSQAYLDSLLMRAMFMGMVTTFLFLVWTPRYRLESLTRRAPSDKQRITSTMTAEPPEYQRIVSNEAGLKGEEDAIEGYWDTIVLLLDDIRMTTRRMFAGYRKEAQEGRTKPGYDRRLLRTSAKRSAATARKSMNEVLDMWTDIEREISDFER